MGIRNEENSVGGIKANSDTEKPSEIEGSNVEYGDLPAEETFLLAKHKNQSMPSTLPSSFRGGGSQLRRSLTDSILGKHLTVRDAWEAELRSIKAACQEHVREARSKEFFLEMGLTRNLSVLPTKQDIFEAADGFSDFAKRLSLLPTCAKNDQGLQSKLEQDKLFGAETDSSTASESASMAENGSAPSKREEQVKQLKKTKKRPPAFAYFTLASAVFALSSIGPFLDRLDGVPAPMRIVWRMLGTAMALSPVALHSFSKNGLPSLTATQWGTFIMTSFSYGVLTVAFSYAVDYTTVNDAAILTNSQSLLLVIVKILMGSQVLWLEGIGVVVAFGGACLCSYDSSSAVADHVETEGGALRSVFGDFLALVSAVGGLGYIVLGKSLRNHVETYAFMFINMTMAPCMVLLFMLATGQEVSFDRHINHGVWGWMHLSPDRLPIEICTVVICNLMGTMGYVRAFKYFSSVIIAVAALLEPVAATFIAVLLHVGVYPSFMGWVGNILVVVGTLAVIYPSFDDSE